MASLVEPYALSQGPHLFVDWRHIHPGAVQWVSKEGVPLSLWGRERPAEAYPAPREVPRGIGIVVQKAQKSGPFLSRTEPWEHMLYCYCTLIHDRNRYRLWYEVMTPEGSDVLCYAESENGFAWQKPCLGFMQYKGEDTNIVFGGGLSPQTGFHGAGVFLDSSHRGDERYKMVFVGREGVYGAVSPDGLYWTGVPEPLMMLSSDTQNSACYDEPLNLYVGFFRMWRRGRRCIGRAETTEFRRWPMATPVIWPGPEDAPSVDWYTNAKCIYPGTTEYHLMFPALYHRAVDRTELHLLSSPDGAVWSRVPGGPVLAPGSPGSWDGGCLFGGIGLVPLDGDRVALPYVGFPVPHKYPRNQSMGAIAYAWWPRGRIAALEAPEYGEFSTQQLLPRGRRLFLNVETKRAGTVLVEVADMDGRPLSGRTFGEADAVNGDFSNIAVTWRGDADLGYDAGQPLVLRFRMRASKLYSFEFA